MKPVLKLWRARAGLVLIGLALGASGLGAAEPPAPAPAKVLVLTEKGGLHAPFVEAARAWLKDLSKERGLEVEYAENTRGITAESLGRVQLVIQLNYPPYSWTPEAAAAFVDYIEKGRGGWVGFHHATLLGEFDGYPLWTWFSDFMGGIRFKNYIAKFASGTVAVEAPAHPVMKGLPASFGVEREEWYTYDRSPRDRVRVLASVDEKTYSPASKITMGDHPVVWSNERVKARNVYVFMGHGPELFASTNYTRLVRNAVLWAAGQEVP